jgi:protocatechuate 3,4-dioxygenase beta subunit
MRRWTSGLTFILIVLNVFLAQAEIQETIDFEGLATGSEVSEVFASGGSGPIRVRATNPSMPDSNAAAIFDSANPTGGDTDLGTPNNACKNGGPGNGTDPDVGPGGEFENCTPLGNLLIIQSENCLVETKGQINCPNDIGFTNIDAPIVFDFSTLGSVTLLEMTFVDIDGNRPDPAVELLDASGNLLSTFDVPNTMPDNGVAVINLGPTSDVVTMIVHLNGPGAIDDIVFKKPMNVCTGSIGDVLWHDLNRDGIQDAGEPGIEGVSIDIIGSKGNTIASQVTKSNGLYKFTGLCAGDYTVAVDETTLAPGFEPTPVDEGSDDTVDSDGSPVDVVLSDDDTSDPTVDFGYSSPCTGAIGDLVWHDTDRDGLQDAGEPGLGGIKVALTDIDGTAVAETTTDADGMYQFTGLCAGQYVIEVNETMLPPGFGPTPTDSGGDDTVDNDGSPATVTLPADDTQDPTADFGYNSACAGSIGDIVWHDKNRDGIQDTDEPGIDHAKVFLKDGVTGSLMAETVTGSDGSYRFTGLCAGDYRVDVDETTIPPNFEPTAPDRGKDDTLDSDGPADGGSVSVSLAGDNANDVTIDFGYFSPCTGTIGNFVWYDKNRNGIQDAAEPGLEGIKVILKDDRGSTIATDTTGPDGSYQFSGLCAGDYSVDVNETDLPPGFEPTLPFAGDAGNDSDGPSDGGAVLITLTADDIDDPTIDFGFVSPCAGSIGDFIWFDENGNGIQETGEAGIESVKVMLKDALNVTIAETTTNADGAYSFNGLCAGEYKVAVDKTTLPAGLEPSVCNAGKDDGVDNDCSPVAVELSEDSSTDRTVDFGYKSKAPDCCPCSGKVTQLTLQYTGCRPAKIKVIQDFYTVVFRGILAPGEQFTITGKDYNGTLGLKIDIYANWHLNTKIITNCFQPIGPGLVSGDFKVIEGYSKNGGLLCPLDWKDSLYGYSNFKWHH